MNDEIWRKVPGYIDLYASNRYRNAWSVRLENVKIL
nr:MAG TPA: hypothetical protein [Caudoviricetes sp.]